MLRGLTNVYDWKQSGDDVVVTVADYTEYANVISGKIKALLLYGMPPAGATLVVQYAGTGFEPTPPKPRQAPRLIIRSALRLPESTSGTTMERKATGEFIHVVQRGLVCLVSFEPVVERRRRTQRRKAYRQLQQAYERLSAVRGYTELKRKVTER